MRFPLHEKSLNVVWSERGTGWEERRIFFKSKTDANNLVPATPPRTGVCLRRRDSPLHHTGRAEPRQAVPKRVKSLRQAACPVSALPPLAPSALKAVGERQLQSHSMKPRRCSRRVARLLNLCIQSFTNVFPLASK